MALHELHARRLATVVTLVEDALDRIESLLRVIEKPGAADPRPRSPVKKCRRAKVRARRPGRYGMVCLPWVCEKPTAQVAAATVPWLPGKSLIDRGKMG